MKHTIYALADPNTLQVRYVGQTSKPAEERLAHHLGAARRNVQQPVYDWIRSLGSAKPVMVILESGIANIKAALSDGHYENKVAASETKWMKRFEKSGQLLCVVPRKTRAYGRLINVPGS